MKKHARQKAYLLVNGVVHLAFILIMTIMVGSLPGYGSLSPFATLQASLSLW